MRSKSKYLFMALLAVVIAALVFATVSVYQYLSTPLTPTQQRVKEYAKAHGYSLWDYPQSLIDLLERNPEAEQFVLEYPANREHPPEIDLSQYKDVQQVPLFLQWDPRWGYLTYGSDMAAITGCGPVCLAMTGYYLTKDEAFSPDAMFTFAQDNGYYSPGNGSSWTLISEGGIKLGLAVKELPLDENVMKRALEQGKPIILAMGPGDFTSSGHYIVIAGVQEGKFIVNDPNSVLKSQQLWSYEQISGQIRNLWSISLP